MSENITQRVSRIVSGTFNKLVDAAENMAPEMVMEEAIREIDQATDEVRAELGRIIAQAHLATTRLNEENSKHDELSRKVKLAVDEGRDDLAEAAVSQLIDIETQIPVLEATIAKSEEQQKELENYVEALAARRREMKDELAQYRQSMSEPPAGGAGQTASSGNSIDRKVEQASSSFERILEKATGVSNGARAAGTEEARKMAELEKMDRTKQIQDRLAAFKSAEA